MNYSNSIEVRVDAMPWAVPGSNKIRAAAPPAWPPAGFASNCGEYLWVPNANARLCPPMERSPSSSQRNRPKMQKIVVALAFAAAVAASANDAYASGSDSHACDKFHDAKEKAHCMEQMKGHK
jgi:hypothetical protein